MRLRRSGAVPFKGTPPDVKRGDPVKVSGADGRWYPKVALGPARYDFDNAIGGRCYLTVPVADPDGVSSVNWPAEYVIAAGQEAQGD